MEINLSEETINTVCKTLRSSKKSLKWKLEVSIPNGKVSIDKKEEFEHELSEVEDALQVFEELIG